MVGAALGRGADSSLAAARRAQAQLGPEVWSEIIRVENDARTARYPRVLHALVFEIAGVLWFYTDADGTQSFSLKRGRLAEDKADFGPLLRDIEPGFKRWTVVPDGAATPGGLPNGCFIESVAALVTRLASGGEAMHPQLLAYYVDTPTGAVGHTVLTYEVGAELEVIDPEGPVATMHFPAALARDRLALARAVRGGDVAHARWLPLDELAARVALFAAGGGAPEPAAAWRRIVTLR